MPLKLYACKTAIGIYYQSVSHLKRQTTNNCNSYQTVWLQWHPFRPTPLPPSFSGLSACNNLTACNFCLCNKNATSRRHTNCVRAQAIKVTTSNINLHILHNLYCCLCVAYCCCRCCCYRYCWFVVGGWFANLIDCLALIICMALVS